MDMKNSELVPTYNLTDGSSRSSTEEYYTDEALEGDDEQPSMKGNVQINSSIKRGRIFIICIFGFISAFIANVASAIIISLVLSNVQSEVARLKSNIKSTTDLLGNLKSLIMDLPPPPEVNVSELLDGYREDIDKLNVDRLELEMMNAAIFAKLDGDINRLTLQDTLNDMTIAQLSRLTLKPQEIADAFVNLSVRAGHEFTSCAQALKISPSASSGYYFIKSAEGAAYRYCDMTRTCGGITGGWMRVYNQDYTDATNPCPDDFEAFELNERRYCRITTATSKRIATLAEVSKDVVAYSKVCGRIDGNQFGYNFNFAFQLNTVGNVKDIDSRYVIGVSITHGRDPRTHIWTFAAADNDGEEEPLSKCACTNPVVSNFVPSPPPYVGNDYFCDTAGKDGDSLRLVYSANPLWDGEGCGPQNSCCSFNNPPWFYRELPQTTFDSIDVRVFRGSTLGYNDDILIRGGEIYIQ